MALNFKYTLVYYSVNLHKKNLHLHQSVSLSSFSISAVLFSPVSMLLYWHKSRVIKYCFIFVLGQGVRTFF